MIKGDVVLIKFPFTDLSGSKLRPAVVLFDSGNASKHRFVKKQYKNCIEGVICKRPL